MGPSLLLFWCPAGALYGVLPGFRFVCTIMSESQTPIPQGASPKEEEEEGLYPTEIFWRDYQPWLKEQGYTLRARYQPDWVPSWEKHPEKPRYQCEDAVGSEVCHFQFSIPPRN